MRHSGTLWIKEQTIDKSSGRQHRIVLHELQQMKSRETWIKKGRFKRHNRTVWEKFNLCVQREAEPQTADCQKINSWPSSQKHCTVLIHSFGYQIIRSRTQLKSVPVAEKTCDLTCWGPAHRRWQDGKLTEMTAHQDDWQVEQQTVKRATSSLLLCHRGKTDSDSWCLSVIVRHVKDDCQRSS